MWTEDNSQNFFLTVIKGVVLTTLVTMICLLVFSLVIKLSYLDGGVIKWVNQFLKIFAIFIGVFLSVKGKGGLVKGSVIGGLSTIIIFIIFAFISGQRVSALTFIVDLIFGLLVGAIIGVMAVNRRG